MTPDSIEMLKVQRSAQWLADHFEEVPLFLFAFVQADPTGGSIFPAVWSAQLAARAEGVGSSLTVVLGVFHAEEIFEILGRPRRRALGDGLLRELRLPDAGSGASRPRRPVHEVSYRNQWGSPVGFSGGSAPLATGIACSFRGGLPVAVATSRGCSSMVEPLPSKQMTRVRSPSAAPLSCPVATSSAVGQWRHRCVHAAAAEPSRSDRVTT